MGHIGQGVGRTAVALSRFDYRWPGVLRPRKREKMKYSKEQEFIEKGNQIVAENSPSTQTANGWKTLHLTVAPCLKEWDIDICYSWRNWPEREKRLPGSPTNDMGIDAVAIRRSDGEHIAIQCKSRQLDEHGSGEPISTSETAKFSKQHHTLFGLNDGL